MKCPKCGYVSFDHLDHCKKCDHNLEDHKRRFGLGGLFTRRKLSGSPSQERETLPEKPEKSIDFGFGFNDSSPGGEPSGTEVHFDSKIRLPSDPSLPEPSPSSADFDSRKPVEGRPRETAPEDGAIPLAGLKDTDLPPPSEERKAGDPDGGLPDLPKEKEGRGPAPFTDDLPPLPSTPDGNEGTLDQPLEVEGEEFFDFSLEWDEEDEQAASSDRPPAKKEKALSGPDAMDQKEGPSDPFESRGTALGRFPVTQTSPEPTLFSDGNPSDIPPPPRRSALFAASLIDLALLMTAFSLFLLAASLVLKGTQGRVNWPDLAFLTRTATPFFLVLFILFFGYFTLLHFFGGQTLGKIFLKLRVEDMSGRPISFSQAVIRSTGGLISGLCLGIGFLIPVFRPGSPAWNDRMAGTRVVPAASTGTETPPFDGPSSTTIPS